MSIFMDVKLVVWKGEEFYNFFKNFRCWFCSIRWYFWSPSLVGFNFQKSQLEELKGHHPSSIPGSAPVNNQSYWLILYEQAALSVIDSDISITGGAAGGDTYAGGYLEFSLSSLIAMTFLDFLMTEQLRLQWSSPIIGSVATLVMELVLLY